MERNLSVNPDPKFWDWMERVEKLCVKKLGVSVDDLEDLPFADCFEAGMNPGTFISMYCNGSF